ncbi:MAG TPA: hypothetical protein VEY09_10360 [Pyrinomonadaceae bacterium]|nr:hypothetical protein [Pyrinomonadaceae bacterium]
MRDAAAAAGRRTPARELTRAGGAARSFAACVAAAWALAAGSCVGGAKTIRLTLVSGETRVSNVDVRVLVENPPGGVVAARTDAEGRLEVPANLRGLRVQIGLDCDGNLCRRVSAPRRVEGDRMTFDVAGGLNLNPAEDR